MSNLEQYYNSCFKVYTDIPYDEVTVWQRDILSDSLGYTQWCLANKWGDIARAISDNISKLGFTCEEVIYGTRKFGELLKKIK